MYFVPSEKIPQLYYKVNIVQGTCQCKAAANKAPCKHKGAISMHFNKSEFSVIPTQDPNMRALYHKIATGHIS